jgi:alpha-1,3-mannosyltransferase
MKIVHIVRQFAPAVGGLEEAVRQLALEQTRSGAPDVRIVTLDRLFREPGRTLPAEDVIEGIRVTRIPFAGSTRYPLAPRVLGELDGADIVHVHAIDFFFDYLAWTKFIHGRTLVASTHGGFFHTEKSKRLKQLWFRTITAASAARYAAICASSAADAAMFRMIAPNRTHTVPNGVDIAKWHDASSATLVPTLLCLGRFSSNKRLPALFPVLAALRAVDPAWRLIVAGMESDLTADDLRHAAAQAGVAESVEIVVGADNDALARLIARSSYAISASAHEGFGLAVVEALSAGLCPVLSDIPAFRTIVAETGRGLIVDFDRPAAAAASIAARHRALATDYTTERAANVAASARYGWPGAAARFDDIYRAVRKSFQG